MILLLPSILAKKEGNDAAHNSKLTYFTPKVIATDCGFFFLSPLALFFYKQP